MPDVISWGIDCKSRAFKMMMNNGNRRPSTVRERFEGHLPEYGTLWRALAAADKKKAGSAAAQTSPSSNNNGHSNPTTKSTNDDNAGASTIPPEEGQVPSPTSPFSSSSSSSSTPPPPQTSSDMPSLLPAILGGKAVKLRVPQQRNRNHDEGCDVPGCVGGCAEPIFEEEAGSYDGTTNGATKDDTLSEDDSDVVVVDASPLPNGTSNDDGDGSVSVSVSSSSSSSGATSRPPRRNVARRNFSSASASGWRRRSDSILSSSSDDGSFNGDTTSEEEWIDGDGESDDDKARGSSASNRATPTKDSAARATSKTTTSNVVVEEEEEEEDDEVIILSNDDEEDDDFNTAASESIGGIDDSSEYAEDSFVVSDGVGDSDNSSSSSSDDDVQIVSPTKKTSKGGAAYPKGKKKPAPQKTKPQPPKSTTFTQDVCRTTFARKREQYTTSTFAEFNAKVFKGSLSSVEVVWSKRLKTTAGLTRLKRIGTSDNMRRIATIELSTKILDNLERLQATMLHEMCHAAAWLVDGVHKPPHGKVFKKWANLSMRRIRDVEVTTTHDYVIRFKFAWKCQNAACGSIIKRHSRSVDPNKHCCGSCKGRLMEIEVPGSKNDVATVGHTPKKKRAPTGFSLFVQQKSKAVREKLVAERGSAVTQPEVMKECGRIWREKKESEKKNDAKMSGGDDNKKGGSNKEEDEDATNDENLPYDLNRAINDMESRLNGLTM